jgi:hypothetical protein
MPSPPATTRQTAVQHPADQVTEGASAGEDARNVGGPEGVPSGSSKRTMSPCASRHTTTAPSGRAASASSVTPLPHGGKARVAPDGSIAATSTCPSREAHANSNRVAVASIAKAPPGMGGVTRVATEAPSRQSAAPSSVTHATYRRPEKRVVATERTSPAPTVGIETAGALT